MNSPKNQGDSVNQNGTDKKPTTAEHLQNKQAHEEADKDIANDKDFKPHPKTHDLDEGELARLDGE